MGFVLELSIRNDGHKTYFRETFSEKDLTGMTEVKTKFIIGKGDGADILIGCDDVCEVQGIITLNKKQKGSPFIYQNLGKGIVEIVDFENNYVATVSDTAEIELKVGYYLIFDRVRNKEKSSHNIKIKIISYFKD